MSEERLIDCLEGSLDNEGVFPVYEVIAKERLRLWLYTLQYIFEGAGRCTKRSFLTITYKTVPLVGSQPNSSEPLIVDAFASWAIRLRLLKQRLG